jgi:hypothetical protein
MDVLKDFYWQSYQIVQALAPQWITLLHDSFRLSVGMCRESVCAMLCCVVLCCVVLLLCYAMLLLCYYYSILCDVMLYYITIRCVNPSYILSHSSITLQYTKLCSPPLHHTTLYYITLLIIPLHCTTLHYTL